MSIQVFSGDGKDLTFRDTAICNYCKNSASQLSIGEKNIGETDFGEEAPDGIFMDARTQKTELTIIYTCDKCRERAEDELLDRYGFAANRYEADQLAQAVSDHFFSNFVPEEDEVQG